MKPSVPDKNAAPASTVPEQGSATTTASRAPIPAAQASQEAQARKDAFVDDIELSVVGGGDRVDRVDHAWSVIVQVDEVLARNNGSDEAQGPSDNSRADYVRGAGDQFPK